MDILPALQKPYIWHWKISISEVANNCYVLEARGPRLESFKMDGVDNCDKLIGDAVNKILLMSPATDKIKYPDYNINRKVKYRIDIDP